MTTENNIKYFPTDFLPIWRLSVQSKMLGKKISQYCHSMIEAQLKLEAIRDLKHPLKMVLPPGTTEYKFPPYFSVVKNPR